MRLPPKEIQWKAETSVKSDSGGQRDAKRGRLIAESTKRFNLILMEKSRGAVLQLLHYPWRAERVGGEPFFGFNKSGMRGKSNFEPSPFPCGNHIFTFRI